MLRALVCCLLLALPLAAAAEERSPVVLTVSGAIENPNRGPFDAFDDAFLARFLDPFEKARSFTLADLAALPQERLTLAYPEWKRSIAFTGPSLQSVLKAAGAKGEKLELLGLDGYSASLTQELIAGGSFLLALTRDGTPLAIGGHGPLWLVFPPGEAAPAYPGDDTGGLVWALFHIDVREAAGDD